MGRDRDQPFNARPDTGRLGFRYCWEAPDERPVVRFADCGCDGCQEFYRRHARAKRPKPVPEPEPVKRELTQAAQALRDKFTGGTR